MNSCSTVQLLDLPDEILIEIFNKLTTVDVFYSILSVNKRLDQLVRDPVFTHFLDLTTKTTYGERNAIPVIMLNQFCSYILPQIHHNIQSLSIETSSIERILQTCNYPKLHRLILHSIKPEVFIKYLSGMKKFIDMKKKTQLQFFVNLDDSPIIHIFKQITFLDIFTMEYYNKNTDADLSTTGYTRLFSICQNLTHLNIKAKYYNLKTWMRWYTLPITMCSSSILIELTVKVRTIKDCLRLLDGRFNQMKAYNVTIGSIETSSLNIDNQVANFFSEILIFNRFLLE